MTIPEKIRNRIAKLQRMAQDTSSENEAMIAAKRLQVLLARYGLDEGFEMDSDDNDIGADEMFIDHTQLGAWAGWIASSVGELYFCHVLQYPTEGTGKNRKRKFTVTGPAMYRTTATLMIKKIIDQVTIESKLASERDRPFGEDGWSFICSFRTAAGRRILARAKELVAEAKRGDLVDDDTGETLPALMSMFEQHESSVMDFYAEQGIEFGKSRASVSANSRAGSRSGSKFGNSVGLRESVSSNAKSRLLA